MYMHLYKVVQELLANLHLNEEHLKNYALIELEKILSKIGRSLCYSNEMSYPTYIIYVSQKIL